MAREALNNVRPHLVLIDGQIAWSDGATCCSELRALYGGEVPLVLLADPNAPCELIEACWRAGIDDCLLRPMRLAQLRSRLDAVTESGRATTRAASSPRVIVLSVDDGRRDRLVRLLESCGYGVLACASCDDSLEEVGAVDLAVVCSDDPAIDGRSLRQHLKTAPAREVYVSSGVAKGPTQAPGSPDAVWMSAAEAGPEAVAEKVNEVLQRCTARCSDRVPFFCPVEFREWGSSRPGEWCSSLSFEMSASGIFLRTLVPARPRAALEMRIHLTTTSEQILATGVVGWANRFSRRSAFSHLSGMGVQFLGMPLSKSLARLIDVCRADERG